MLSPTVRMLSWSKQAIPGMKQGWRTTTNSWERLISTSLGGLQVGSRNGLFCCPAMALADSSGLKNISSCDALGQTRSRSNRSKRGLYDGKDIRSGNNVSFSMKKTKRKFKPNVLKKAVYSETLDEMVRFHLTASTLRSIDKAGGLDNYLLKSKHVVPGKNEGWTTKNRILQKMRTNDLRQKAAESNATEQTSN
uniref:Large ribosomal subunit protein bL28m n=1 Tax=Trieres chinensis TaxID=1514140 RepID=A0A7S1Z364_TRICV|mmetsp:Transcript_16611/g.34052  ORF Transcript_16611/g.34052 Transcript_16611/m.34052 type:complete len:194 (+) Transcript_16611:78-659(+)